MASRAISGSAPMAATADDGDEPAKASAPKRAAAVTQTASARTTTYRVKRGDTLFGIAQLFDTTVAKIKSLEPAERRNRITPGTRLKIAR